MSGPYTISGAGTAAANVTVTESGTIGGKPKYTFATGSILLYWHDGLPGYWAISGAGGNYYFNNDTGSLPPTSGWLTDSDGTFPAPTVTLGGGGSPTAAIFKANGTDSIPDGDSTPQDFGSAIIGGSAPQLTFVVKNTGTATLNISSVTAPTGYAIDGGSDIPGGGTTITASAQKNLVANLLTASAGTKTGSIHVFSDDGTSPDYDFTVTGTITTPALSIFQSDGTTPIPPGDSTPQDFGNVVKGASVVLKTFKLNNTAGTADLTISSVTYPTGFGVDATSDIAAGGGTVTAGTTANLIIKLLTATAGSKSGDVTVNSDDPTSPVYNWAVSGTVTVPDLVVTDPDSTPIAAGETSPYDFGSHTVGSSPGSIAFHLDNSAGTSDLTVSSITLPSRYDFDGASGMDGAGGTVTAGDVATVLVVIDTGSAGTFSGNITVNSDDPDNPAYAWAITGEVDAVPALLVYESNGTTLVPDGDATPQDFGTVNVGDSPVLKTFVVSNAGGTSDLVVGDITFPTGYGVDSSSDLTPSGGIIGAGDTATLILKLLTSVAGVKSGDVELNSNDPTASVYNWAITGEVVSYFTASPSTLPTGTTGNTVTLTGNGTTWDSGTPGSPIITISTDGLGAEITNQVTNSETSITLTVSIGTSGTITFTDPSDSHTATLTATPVTAGGKPGIVSPLIR